MEFPPTAGNLAEPTVGEGRYSVWLSYHALSFILLICGVSQSTEGFTPFLPPSIFSGYCFIREINAIFCRIHKVRAPNLFFYKLSALLFGSSFCKRNDILFGVNMNIHLISMVIKGGVGIFVTALFCILSSIFSD
jgi:hypothetical protein